MVGADQADPFQFEQGDSFAGALIESVGGITTPTNCLAAVARWIEEERQNRGMNNE